MPTKKPAEKKSAKAPAEKKPAKKKPAEKKPAEKKPAEKKSAKARKGALTPPAFEVTVTGSTTFPHHDTAARVTVDTSGEGTAVVGGARVVVAGPLGDVEVCNYSLRSVVVRRIDNPEARTLPLPQPPPVEPPPVEPPPVEPPPVEPPPVEPDNEPDDPHANKAALPQNEAREIELADIRYDESVNVRQVELVAAGRRLRGRWEAGITSIGKRVEDITPGSLEYVDQEDPDYLQLKAQCADLLGSIPRLGLLEPLVVCPDDVLPASNAFVLDAGYRRTAVLWFLFGGTYKTLCTVKRFDVAHRLAANLAENAARRSVETHRAAERCYELKHVHGWSYVAIAESSGYSKSHTENLVRVKAKLSPKIWDLWTKWPNAVSFEYLLTLLPHDHATQERMWEEQMTGGGHRKPRTKRPTPPPPPPPDEGAGDEGDSDSDEPPPAPAAVEPVRSRAELEIMLQVVHKTSVKAELGSTLEAWCMGAAQAIQAALRVPGVTFAPPNPAAMPRRPFEGAEPPKAPSAATARAVAGKAGGKGAA